MATCFHLIEEKQLPTGVKRLQWSPSKDLVACISVEGSVSLHRFLRGWQRVWEIAVDEARGPATAVEWRPDGRVLAVGFSGGTVRIYNVEGAHCLHEVGRIAGVVTCLSWSELTAHGKKHSYEDKCQGLVPNLPSLPSRQWRLRPDADGDEELGIDFNDSLITGDQTTILVCGDDKGSIHVVLDGLFLVATLDSSRSSKDSECSVGDAQSVRVLNVALSSDWQYLSVTVGRLDSTSETIFDVCLVHIHCVLLSECCWELKFIAQQYGRLSATVEYVAAAMSSMSEAWEDMLDVIDKKLNGLAEKLSCGRTVGGELRRLLTRGSAHWETASYLRQNLSQDSIKQISLRIDSCYSQLHRVAIFAVQQATGLVLARCEVMREIAKRELFSKVGLLEDSFAVCCRRAASVLLKADELCSVISSMLDDLQVFFKWLHDIVLPVLSGEDSVGWKLTSKELQQLTRFLMCVINSAEQHGCFTVEHVGQYLKDQPLTVTTSANPSSWSEQVQRAGCDWLFDVDQSTSLMQEAVALQDAVVSAFSRCAVTVGCTFVNISHLYLLPRLAPHPRMYDTHCCPSISGMRGLTQCVVSEEQDLILLVHTADRKDHSHGVCVQFVNSEEDSGLWCVLDAVWYTENVLALLLQPPEKSSQACIAQLCLGAIDSLQWKPLAENDQYDSKQLVTLEADQVIVSRCTVSAVDVVGLAVNGVRETACVVASNGHRLLCFDKDYGEDEEDDDANEFSSP